MLLGNVVLVVGVAGRTLTLECGERVEPWRRDVAVLVGDAKEVEDVEDALEWEWWCFEPPPVIGPGAWGIERIEDIDDEVDLRPRRPAEERRYEECGVSGEGERDARWRDRPAAVVVVIDGRWGYVWERTAVGVPPAAAMRWELL